MKKFIKQKLLIVFAFILIIFISTYSIYGATDTETNKKTFDLNLYSNYAILMDADSGAVLFDKGAYSKVYPASTTKILTAILVIETLDLDTPVVASKNAIYSTPLESSSVYLKVGEVMTVKNLLYCLLLNSGNDAANVLAEAAGTTTENFVDMMNKKAKDIGALNTHFTSAHGFHDDNHYTTPYDMMKILQYAIKNEKFREICETKSMVINETNMTHEKRYLKNSNKLLFTTSEDPKGLYYEYNLGGKTGYTIEARGTYVGYAKKGDSYILVGAFDGSQNVSGQEARFLDAVTLFNHGFNNFNKELLFDKNKTKFEVVDKVNKKKYVIGIKDNIYSLADKQNYTLSYSLNVNFDELNKIDEKTLNIYSSENPYTQSVGKISYTAKGVNWNLNNENDLIVYSVENYIVAGDVIKTIVKVILFIILAFILFIVLVFIVAMMKNKSEKKKTLKVNRKRNIKGENTYYFR